MNQLYDGHSRVYFFSDSEKYIDDFSQINEYGNPITINGEPTEKILESFLNLFQYERVEFAQAVFGEYIKQELYLNWLGVDTSDGVTFKYVTDSGEKEYHYSFVPYENVANFLIHNEPYYYTVEKKENAYDGKVFILTDVFTFSSAMDFAMFFKDNNLGTVVGEASGNMPEAYGDMLRFTVPNSKLGFSVSYKKWFRIDRKKCDEPIMPDYECKSQDALSYAKQLIVEKKYE